MAGAQEPIDLLRKSEPTVVANAFPPHPAEGRLVIGDFARPATAES